MKRERFPVVNVREHPDRIARRAQLSLPFKDGKIRKSMRRELLDRKIRKLLAHQSQTT